MEALLDAERRGELPVKIVGVGSDRKEAEAVRRAQARGIPVEVFTLHQYQSQRKQEEAILAWAHAAKLELLLLAGYRRVMSGDLLQLLGCPVLNIHPSLLPAFPGLNAQQQALDYGVKISGCTVHYVDAGLDSGPIILQAAVPVWDDDTVESLSARIRQEERRLYPEAVRLVASGRVELRGRLVNRKQLEG